MGIQLPPTPQNMLEPSRIDHPLTTSPTPSFTFVEQLEPPAIRLPADTTPELETKVNTHPMVTRSKAGIYKPKAYNVDLTSAELVSIHEAMLNDK